MRARPPAAINSAVGNMENLDRPAAARARRGGGNRRRRQAVGEYRAESDEQVSRQNGIER
jgi:hypothetical protein